jgi:hypothetical protein
MADETQTAPEAPAVDTSAVDAPVVEVTAAPEIAVEAPAIAAEPTIGAPAIEEAPEVITHESFVQGLKDLLHTVETGAEDIINYVEKKIHKIQA